MSPQPVISEHSFISQPTQMENVNTIPYSELEKTFNIEITTNTKPLDLYSIEPDMIEYAKDILLYLNLKLKFKEHILKGLVDEIYIINKNWIQIFKQNSGYQKMKTHFKKYETYFQISQNKKMKFQPQITNIPSINNNDLLIPMCAFLNDGNDTNQRNKILQPELKIKQDFKEISKGMWDILFKYFKGDTPIIRPYITMNTPFKYRSLKLNVMFIPERQYIVNKEYIQNNIQEYIIYINDNEKSSTICNHIQSIITSASNEKLKLSMCNSNVETMSIYQLKDQKTLCDFKQFLINNIDDITIGKSIDINQYVKKISQPFVYSTNYFVQEEQNFIIEFNNNKLLFISEYIQLMDRFNNNDKMATNVNHNYNTETTDNYLHIMHTYDTKDFINIEEESLSSSPLSETNNLSGKVGLTNLGNTCFMNTGLQCLSNCQLLTNYILSKIYLSHINTTNPIGSHGELINAYAELITHIWYGSKTVLAPHRFKKAISKFQEMFNGFSQHDSHEFLSFLLDGLHEDLNKVINKPYVTSQDENNDEFYEANKTWKIFKMRNQSIIVDLFYGLHRSMLFCQNKMCNYISTTFDPFSTLSLTVLNSFKEKGITCVFVFYDLNIKALEFKMIINEETTEKGFRYRINKLLGVGEYSFDIMIKASNEFDIIDEKKHYTIMNFINKRNSCLYLIQRSPLMIKEYGIDYKSIEDKVKNNIEWILNDNEHEEECASVFNMTDHIKSEMEWMKVTLYQSVYNIAEGSFENISQCRNVYFNINWNNKEVYYSLFEYFLPILQEIQNIKIQNNANSNEQNDNNQMNVPINILDDIINNLFPELKQNTIPQPLKNKNQPKSFYLHKLLSKEYPFVLVFHQTRNCYSSKLTFEEKPNRIFVYDKTQFSLKKILSQKEIQKQSYNEHEFLFSIIWNKEYINIINSYLKPLSTQIDYNPSYKTEDPEIGDLIQMLDAFVKKETLSEDNQWLCPKCLQEQTADKKMDIYSCPDILIIQLKRFKNDKKIETLVKFPINNLDINNLVKKKDPSEVTQYTYDLFAIANHVGGIHGGHYYAYAKNWKLNKWFEFNDTFVSEIEESKLISKHAYVLFYCRNIERTQSQINAFYNSEYEDIELPNVVKQFLSTNK